MMTCKDVSLLLSTGQLDDAPLSRRLAVRLHLALCRHCTAFRRQLERLARAARAAGREFDREPTSDFESKVGKRLESEG